MLQSCLTLLKADEGSCASTPSPSKPWLSCKILPEAASSALYLIHIGVCA